MKLKYTLAAFAATTLAASAATIVDTGTVVSGGQGNFGAGSGNTFTTGVLGAENVLSTIAISGPTTGALATTHGVELWTDIDGDFETWDLGTLVAASTGAAQSLDDGAVFTTFNFSGGTLTDGTVYAWVLTDGAGTATAGRWGVTNDGDALADGALFDAGTQPFGGAYDTAMVITTTTIPEPSSTALLGLGGLALILRRRK